MDSVTTAHYVKKKLNYQNITILFFNYGQRSLISERKYSKLCANKIGASFREIQLPELSKISKSQINKKVRVSKISRKDLKNSKKESDKYYVPFRNGLFLSYGIALAESLKGGDIFVGFKNEGSESYPDTTKEFVNSINNLAKFSNSKIRVKSPLIKKDKEEIIKLGIKLGVDLSKTHSCYIKNKHCGYCLACMLRKEGFYWSEKKDPTKYLKK